MLRQEKNHHRSLLIWLTGLSGAGKSTIANALAHRLHNEGCSTYVLDGDNVRHGLNRDLGFSDSDRSENIRRIGEVAKLFVDAGIITIAAFISPFRDDRERVRALVGSGDYLEIYCRCPLDICEQRDVKGLYKKARTGELAHFTGLSSAYEAPDKPDLILDTDRQSLEGSVEQIFALLTQTHRIWLTSDGAECH